MKAAILLPGVGGSAMRSLWLVNGSVESCSADLSSRSDSGIGVQPPAVRNAVFQATWEKMWPFIVLRLRNDVTTESRRDQK